MSKTSDMHVQQQENTITVCDKCLQATCWQGIFYCDDYKTAGTKEIHLDELRALLNLKHPDYWTNSSDNKPE